MVVIGGGPGGYEAALVAAQEGAQVVLIERDGVGGAAVLTDCVPSKTLVATARSASLAAESAHLGVRIDGAATIDDDDDVQTVWGNYEIPDAVMEKLG